MEMVENPEKDNFDTYHYIFSRNPYPFASVDRIVTWALQGRLEAIAEDEKVKTYFQNLLKKTRLDFLDTRSILRSMLVFGDAYARLVRDNEGDIVRLHYLSSRNVEIMCDDEGNETEYVWKIGNGTSSFSPKDVLHFRWKPQKDTPYGTSLMKGLERIVARDNQIKIDFLKALRGQIKDFDSERSLEVLKTIPFLIAKHTQVPIGLLTMRVENELAHRLQMNEFERLCQTLRDLIRNEIIEKIIKPETERKGFQEIARIGWKRKDRPSLEEVERIIENMKRGVIPLEEAQKQLGLKDYYA